MEQVATQPPKKDDTLSGLLVIAGVLMVIIGFIYLLSVQQKSDDCETLYNPDGTIKAGCALSEPIESQTPQSDVELLDQLNEDTTSEVDKSLQEAAQELQQNINKQNQQSQQQQQAQPMQPQQ